MSIDSPNNRAGTPSRELNINPKLVGAGVLIVLAVVFVFQNTDKAKLKIIFFTVTMPRWIAFVVLVLIGMVIGYILRGVRAKRSGRG